jgi:hypothetical protein
MSYKDTKEYQGMREEKSHHQVILITGYVLPLAGVLTQGPKKQNPLPGINPGSGC